MTTQYIRFLRLSYPDKIAVETNEQYAKCLERIAKVCEADKNRVRAGKCSVLSTLAKIGSKLNENLWPNVDKIALMVITKGDLPTSYHLNLAYNVLQSSEVVESEDNLRKLCKAGYLVDKSEISTRVAKLLVRQEKENTIMIAIQKELKFVRLIDIRLEVRKQLRELKLKAAEAKKKEQALTVRDEKRAAKNAIPAAAKTSNVVSL